MDPNLFHVDLERLFELLMAIVVLSFFVERALSLVFGHRLYVKLEERGFKGGKEIIALLVSVAGCYYWQFDAISVLLVKDENSRLGYLLTGAVIAGGSKASIRLFYDVMNVKTQAEKDYVTKTRSVAPAAVAPLGNPATVVVPHSVGTVAPLGLASAAPPTLGKSATGTTPHDAS